MKMRALYLFLAAGVVVLIIAAAFLSRSLLNLSVETPPVEKANAAPPPPLITETVMDTGSAPSTPSPAQPKALPPSTTAVTPDAAKPPVVAPPASTAPGIGSVVSLRGTATATDAEKKARILAQDGRVFMNDRIETGPNSKLKIKLDDGSLLSEGENSALLIDEYVYTPGKTKECGFTMRIMKGACRVITGFITRANPDRFKVRTRMATVGIRGCDVAFRSTPERDDIYVLELAGEKKVVIAATKNGAPVVDLVTGQDLPVAEDKRQTVDIVENGRMVSVVPGKGISAERLINQDEVRDVITETSYLPPARHDLDTKADGATFTLQPAKPKTTGAGDSEKAP